MGKGRRGAREGRGWCTIEVPAAAPDPELGVSQEGCWQKGPCGIRTLRIVDGAGGGLGSSFAGSCLSLLVKFHPQGVHSSEFCVVGKPDPRSREPREPRLRRKWVAEVRDADGAVGQQEQVCPCLELLVFAVASRSLMRPRETEWGAAEAGEAPGLRRLTLEVLRPPGGQLGCGSLGVGLGPLLALSSSQPCCRAERRLR